MKTHPDKDRLWRARYDQINAAKNYLAHRALFYAAHRWEGDYALTHREPQITALRKQLLQISTRLTSLLAGLGERANGGQ
ncbi:MAG: hypothetical protein IT371_26560 [Deltaproteobacteria bacterium]|nr:hypothetical protein [Deltaproteobacteria bacterium]